LGELLTPLDITIFFGSLVGIMALGLWAGREEETSEDYFMAGRKTRWWGVAASIFGSNISANQFVGMMGLGFSVGFAQSNFEISAVAGLLVMCYAFLPIYRKLKVYTLSEYLEKRFDANCRLLYALIMVFVMVVIHTVPAFYIGSRSINILLQGGPGEIEFGWYAAGVLVMAVVCGSYTIIGGLKAVILTDAVQSVLMLFAGLMVAWLTFSQPEVGGWSGMVNQDIAGAEKLHLYRPSNDPALPWSGVLIGLILLHFNYWGTNQFIVQRAISARSDRAARTGIIAAGFLKLLIPFYSVGAGIAAYYLLAKREMDVAPDAVFTTLLAELVAPVGFGLLGIVAAGLMGAILSSIDSMMNSAATIVTFDVYRRYFHPHATEKQLIWVGRLCILLFVIAGTLISLFTIDPNSTSNFYLSLTSSQSKLVIGIVVAFLMGMLWPRTTAAGGLAALLAGIVFGFSIPMAYGPIARQLPGLIPIFGEQLNFMHTATVNFVLTTIVCVVVSLNTQHDPEKSKFTWTGLEIFTADALKRFFLTLAVTISIYIVLGFALYLQMATPWMVGSLAAAWTMLVFTVASRNRLQRAGQTFFPNFIADDLFHAGALAGTAVFMLGYFA